MLNKADTVSDTLRGVDAVDNITDANHYAHSSKALFAETANPTSSFDPIKLQRIIENLSGQGVDIRMGQEFRQILKSLNKEAAYIPRFGNQPGTILLPDNPSRVAVIEELIHLGQDRNSGWKLAQQLEESYILEKKIEFSAKEKLLEIGKRLNFPAREMDNITRWLQDNEVWRKFLFGG